MKIADEYYTLTEAATRLGVNRLTIRRWLQAGKLEAQRAGGVVFIERAIVENLKPS